MSKHINNWDAYNDNFIKDINRIVRNNVRKEAVYDKVWINYWDQDSILIKKISDSSVPRIMKLVDTYGLTAMFESKITIVMPPNLETEWKDKFFDKYVEVSKMIVDEEIKEKYCLIPLPDSIAVEKRKTKTYVETEAGINIWGHKFPLWIQPQSYGDFQSDDKMIDLNHLNFRGVPVHAKSKFILTVFYYIEVYPADLPSTNKR